jgi:cytochrome c oxidase subunit III
VSLTVAFAGILAGAVVWWLAVRRLTTRPWEAQGTSDGRDSAAGTVGPPSARVGLWIFLAVITSLFALFITGYWMRMGHGMAHGLTHDWHPLAEPSVLWVNTVLLGLGSVAMQWARVAINRGDMAHARNAWWLGGGFAFAFLVGQYLAWRQLQATGYYAAANPANAAFYLLTGVHALHLAGGLVAWARGAARMARGGTPDEVRLGVELCTVYWHYLLLVWLVLFGLLLRT